MSATVGVLAQVPAEAQCLRATISSLSALGEVVVFSAEAGEEVGAAATALGAPVIALPWTRNYGDLFTLAAQRLGDGPWLIAYADETVAEPGGLSWSELDGPLAAGVRHRTSDRDTYTEENECRAVGSGATPPTFAGLVYAQALRDGARTSPNELPHTGIVLEHYPTRWPDLSAQRLACTAAVYRAALADSPRDPELLYGLFHCHYSAHEWPQVRDLAARWRNAAEVDDPNRPLVDYYEACAAVAGRDTADALRLASGAVAHAPTFADGWYLIGELHASEGRLSDADEAFATAVRIGLAAEPLAVEDHSLATWRAWQARAAVAKRDGRRQQAEEFLRRARQVRRELSVGAGGR